MSIRLLVGLGNPGTQYANTRHNAGFWLLDRYARSVGANFRSERGFFSELARTQQAWLMKPQTFMNRSGQAVAALAGFYKIKPDEILIVHDELDLLPGVVKIKRGGGHAGHNGLKDIAAQLGTPDFWRMRIGIGHPRTLGLNQEVVDFVLHPPRKEEQTQIDEAIDRCLMAIPLAFEGTMETVMMKLHSKP
jgi:PTH1 family peptidyl-tRNA hydrolase